MKLIYLISRVFLPANFFKFSGPLGICRLVEYRSHMTNSSSYLAEICKHGNLPTVAPVKPYTELALIFKASCRPSKTFFLNGSVSFFRSALACFRALNNSSRMTGSNPFRICGLTKRFPEGVFM